MVFTAELHDIVKLLDRQSLNPNMEAQGHGKLKSQSFDGVCFDPNTLPEPATTTWKAIIRHEEEDSWKILKGVSAEAGSEEIEFRRQRFITTLADRFASSIAREQVGGTESKAVKKLWGPKTEDLTLKDITGLRNLLSYIASDPVWNQFAERYYDQLHAIPEDRKKPFTSLYNHLCLTGKIARILSQQVQLKPRGGEWFAVFRGVEVQSVDEAHGTKKTDIIGKWRFSLVKVWAEIPQYMVRLQDLSILGERRAALERLSEKYPDNLLYFTEDFALMFWTDFSPSILNGLGDFQWKFRITESDLTTMSSALDEPGGFDSERGRRHGARVYEGRWPSDCSEVIDRPLCPVCQTKQATKEWRKGTLTEFLCVTCFKRRETAPSAERYANWDELGTDVAWIKLAAWPEAVRKTVQHLFVNEVGSFPDVLQDFRSIPLEVDFLEDYVKVLREWRSSTDNNIPAEQLIQPVVNYQELVILRLDQPDLWLLAVEYFCSALAKIMPKLMDDASGNGCPVQLFIDISSTKYPFHEHWRYFNHPMPMAVNIRDSRRSIELSLSPSCFQDLISLSKSVEYRSSLRELAELFEVTRSRAAVLVAAWERRAALEKQLRSSAVNILEWVQLARLLGR